MESCKTLDLIRNGIEIGESLDEHGRILNNLEFHDNKGIVTVSEKYIESS